MKYGAPTRTSRYSLYTLNFILESFNNKYCRHHMNPICFSPQSYVSVCIYYTTMYNIYIYIYICQYVCNDNE